MTKKELVIDRVVYIDIPKVFEIKEPELLARILSIVSASPGLIVDYENLADDLGRNRKTISNYLFYLEKAFLVKKLYNYSKNLLTSEKKNENGLSCLYYICFIVQCIPRKNC